MADEKLEALVRNFFGGLSSERVSPQRELTTKRLPGVFAELRAETMASAKSLLRIEPYLGRIWKRVDARVFRVTVVDLCPLASVLALYNDSDILWLDHHDNDSDFAKFVEQERLSTWLAEAPAELVDLLLNTKCYFLSQPEPPQLIRQVDDIPFYPNTDAITQLKDPVTGKTWAEVDEQDRATIAPLIHPPRLSQLSSAEAQLEFCVWTRILGRVFELRCHFGTTVRFRLHGTMLGEGVGKAFYPR